jgi:hypothetical protein
MMTKELIKVLCVPLEQKGYQPTTGVGKVQGGYQAPTSTNVPTKPPNDGSSGTKK